MENIRAPALPKPDVQLYLGLADLQVVEAFHTINQGGDDPTGDEDADDREAETRKIIVQATDDAPEPAFEAELVADQPKDFDAADKDGNYNRRRSDCQVVPELADRVDERPAVGAGHQHTVGGVH